jgi:glyoxylase-like metal-dependent hydrolase (beta-lactamase superfamily II)
MCHHAVSRRSFLQRTVIGSIAGNSILELAFRRAAWARASAAGAPTDLFNLEKIADGVYFALAKPQALVNCNAAIFVNSDHVLVVDAHSKPSAAAAMIAQIKQQITTKPVRYLVNTHFHWDHAQGNAAYHAAFGKGLTIIASETGKQMQAKVVADRLHASLDPHLLPFPGQPHVPELIESAKQRISTSTDPHQKTLLQNYLRQLEAYEQEMQHYENVLPTVTFEKTYVINDSAQDLHVEFHGRGHTGGDVVVFCPQRRVVATGDLILGELPFLRDGYPKEWPATIASVATLPIDFVLCGHGDVQRSKQAMLGERAYLEELTTRVEAGKHAGKSISEIQKSMPVSSIKALQTSPYGDAVRQAWSNAYDPLAQRSHDIQVGVNTNIEHVFERLGES